MRLTGENTLREMTEQEYVKPFVDYFLYNGQEMFEERLNQKIVAMHPGVECGSMLNGLNRVLELAESGNFYYPVYEAEEQDDPQMKDVNIMYFPAQVREDKEDRDRPYILVCPGGAYMNVWSFTEGYTAAARYNEYGYTAFVLTYRTTTPDTGKKMFPKPMQDVAAALKFIRKNADKFGVNGDKYIVNGFSAGGNLTLQWGTKINGYEAYDLPKPAALFPIYPVVSFVDYLEDPLFTEMAEVAMGKGFTSQTAEQYEVLKQIDEDYPPVFDAYCNDDDLVPAANSETLKKKLEEHKIPCSFLVGNVGGHGFSEGLHTDCAGWVRKAIDFYESL